MFTGSPQPTITRGEEWWLAHQRALREAHGDDLDGNESAPYGLSVPANPRILLMRGQGKGIEGRGQRGVGKGKHRPGVMEGALEGTGGAAWPGCSTPRTRWSLSSSIWYQTFKNTHSAPKPVSLCLGLFSKSSCVFTSSFFVPLITRSASSLFPRSCPQLPPPSLCGHLFH